MDYEKYLLQKSKEKELLEREQSVESEQIEYARGLDFGDAEEEDDLEQKAEEAMELI